MRKITTAKIKQTVSELCIEANIDLRKDVLSALKKAFRLERNRRAKNILKVLIENAKIAKKEKLAICQDTGVACVYLEIGQGVKIIGGDLEKAVNDGVRIGYKKGYFRNSIVDPITRKNTNDNTPAVIHTKIVKGDRIKITVVPKGFGCENKTQLKMFKPTADINEIKKFVIETVKAAGPDACPPFVIGVGIGGTADYAMYLAKNALLKKRTRAKQSEASPKGTHDACLPTAGERTTHISKLERDLLTEINKLNIGPMGLGGKTSALGVNILTYPTHIAGMPVAVSIGCHAMRSALRTL